MGKYPITPETLQAQTSSFEKELGHPFGDQEKELISIITDLENKAYEQGRADALEALGQQRERE